MKGNIMNIISQAPTKQPDYGKKHIKSISQLSEGQQLNFCRRRRGNVTRELMVTTSDPYEEDEMDHWVIDASAPKDDFSGVYILSDFGVVEFVPGRWEKDAWIERAE